jgi:hypothetical protein
MGNVKPSREYLAELRRRYRRATKKERGAILDEFVKTTGYHRKHANALLRGTRQHHTGPIRHPRAKRYGEEERRAVRDLAELFDQINSKRLRVAMDTNLATLRRQRHLHVSADCYERLQHISPATMDRLRAGDRAREVHGRSFTKPGSLLKAQIPIRTFADWDDAQPGFVECDLVDHSGGNSRGEFAFTLTMTDVWTGWTELRAVRNKAQKHVLAAIQFLQRQWPVTLLGLDSDNGSEFINEWLVAYCEQAHITFTRGRVGRKNDNCFVEQKNWSVARRLVGYGRYDRPSQVELLNRLYRCYGLYVNFFLPVMKLKEKVRVGSRTKRVYDQPQTPYARVLASPDVPAKVKARLRKLYATLDVVELKREIDALVRQLHPTAHAGLDVDETPE